MNKNKWFKHYNDSSQGLTIRTLLDQQDYEAVALWWVIHELISRYESYDARGKVVISEKTLAREINMKPSRTERVLGRISAVSQLRYDYETDEKQGRNISFLSPNWLKLQETRGGKRQAKNEQKICKDPTDIRRKTEDIRHNNTITGNAIASPGFDLERVYQAYPRKLGKAEGMSRLKAMIKTDEDYQAFEKAVANYAAYIKREKIEPRFIKQFSSFVGSQKVQPWRDYLDDDVGKTLQDRKTKKIFYTVEDIENDLRQKS